MATTVTKEREEVDESAIRDAIARTDKSFRALESARAILADFDWKAMRSDIVLLLNSRESLTKMKKIAEIGIAAAEREAQSRLASVDSGHRAMLERLELREISVSRKEAEVETLKLSLSDERRKYDLLNAELERQKQGLDRVTAKK